MLTSMLRLSDVGIGRIVAMSKIGSAERTGAALMTCRVGASGRGRGRREGVRVKQQYASGRGQWQEASGIGHRADWFEWHLG